CAAEGATEVNTVFVVQAYPSCCAGGLQLPKQLACRIKFLQRIGVGHHIHLPGSIGGDATPFVKPCPVAGFLSPGKIAIVAELERKNTAGGVGGEEVSACAGVEIYGAAEMTGDENIAESIYCNSPCSVC